MSQQPPPPAIYLQALTGYWQTLTLKAVAELGLADLMKDGPLTSAALAAQAGLHEPSLRRVLRALTGAGFLEETTPGTYGLTPVGDLLRSDRPDSFRWMVLAEFEPARVPAWHGMEHSLRTGEIAFDHVQGKSAWDYYRENPERGERFSRWMTQLSHFFSDMIVGAFDFRPCGTIIDCGGGQGILLEAMLRQAEHSQGILFDLPQVVDGLAERPRMRRVGGSFFEGVPEGGDLYVLKFILHDWDDAKSIAILRNIRQSMKPGAKVMVIESVVGDSPDASFTHWMDINMLVMTGGMERTREEYGRLFEASGLRLEQLVPTPGVFSLLVAGAV